MTTHQKPPFQYFYSLYLFTWLCIITGVFMFTLARGMFFVAYGAPELYTAFRSDLLQSFKTGFLFDLKTMAIVCSPFFLLSYTGFLWKTTQPVAIFSQCYRWIQVILLSACSLLLILQHLSYGPLPSTFHPLALEQWKVSLKAIFTHYPTIKLGLFWIFSSLLLKALVNRYYQHTAKFYFNPSAGIQALYLSIAFAFYGLVCHGSLSKAPLTVADTQFSTPVINAGTQNAVVAFYKSTQQALHHGG